MSRLSIVGITCSILGIALGIIAILGRVVEPSAPPSPTECFDEAFDDCTPISMPVGTAERAAVMDSCTAVAANHCAARAALTTP